MTREAVVATLRGQIKKLAVVEDVLDTIGEQDKEYAGRIRGAVRSAMRDAAGVLEDHPEGDTGGSAWAEAYQHLSGQLSELTFNLFGQRERFIRKTEALDAAAARHTDWMVETYEQMFVTFLGGQFDALRADLKSDHQWYSGLEDAGRKVSGGAVKIWNKAAGALSKLDPDLNKLRAGTEPDWDRSLLERLYEKYLSGKSIERFTAQLGRELQTGLAQRWKQTTEEVISDIVVAFEEGQKGHRLETALSADLLDDASRVALYGMAAATTATVVLAAGWHTLAWSLSGLFLPLLPVVAIATAATALVRKDRALTKLLEKVGEQERTLAESVRQGAQYKMRLEIQRANQQRADQTRQEIFHRVIGRFEHRKLDRLLRAFEDLLDELSAASRSADPTGEAIAGVDWFARGKASLDSGDELAAAMYGSLAFEQTLRDINRRLSLGFDFRVPHHNRAFIDRLAGSGKGAATLVGALRSLKSRRDMFTHRMHQLAAMSEGRRTKTVRRYFADLEEARGLF